MAPFSGLPSGLLAGQLDFESIWGHLLRSGPKSLAKRDSS